jgi:excisionase family DNA binding protein
MEVSFFMKKKLLTVPKAARILGVKENSAYRMAREGFLPVVHLGRLIRIDEEQLMELINRGGYR